MVPFFFISSSSPISGVLSVWCCCWFFGVVICLWLVDLILKASSVATKLPPSSSNWFLRGRYLGKINPQQKNDGTLPRSPKKIGVYKPTRKRQQMTKFLALNYSGHQAGDPCGKLIGKFSVALFLNLSINGLSGPISGYVNQGYS